MDFNNLANNAKELGKKTTSSLSEALKPKLKEYVRDKAKKEVTKDCVSKGVDIVNMKQDDFEYLISDKEKEIWNKIEKKSLLGIVMYLVISMVGL